MIIEIKKFGTTLVSRPAGKEAWLAFQPVLKQVSLDEKIIVDFDSVAVLTPSWADEFLTPLESEYKERVELHNINNPSVQATLAILKSNLLSTN
jgi:hypothetical protein